MKKKDILSRLVTTTGTKGCDSHVGAGCTFCPGWCYQLGQKVLFCPGCQTRDKRAPPFIPDWRSRLGNRDNSGFPTGTNQRFYSSDHGLFRSSSDVVWLILLFFVSSGNIILTLVRQFDFITERKYRRIATYLEVRSRRKLRSSATSDRVRGLVGWSWMHAPCMLLAVSSATSGPRAP